LPDAPIIEFLWEVTLPAVRAAWAAGREYVESGNKYVPRSTKPDLGYASAIEIPSFCLP
jgi:hypothetical protein